ncbi:hypothetical protein COLO4_02948 [Corchorus olitorius]|uniref:Uncharacterized protein n=1 Tax=Corchorus olitorius TaxID=93759 RepID=A0A1R3KZU6_9ROSI|nr:hypothetical protein COLO4_02948 [Corchorus olitorius]
MEQENRVAPLDISRMALKQNDEVSFRLLD